MKLLDKIKRDRTAPEDRKKKSALRENLEVLAIALVLAFIIRAFVIQPFKIPTGSMKNTLLVGDQIFVTKFSYGFRLPFTNTPLIPTWKPKQGDIVVFRYPEDRSVDYIKRVIGLPGDTVELRGKTVYVNGKPLEDETYAMYTEPDQEARLMPSKRRYGPTLVPEGKYFVMGDNRDNSSDSRYWGFVDYEDLRGKAQMIYFSWDSQDFDIRWSRIGDILH